ncbi:translationally-controlled tumor protein homolog isoform X1 [Periophthalmus magnuspinnatus]|uniref:translationally-controlled tumor protein homolog isoform X1 n=2 Tax=Periophthalmus magnuspinnatus TaxID=409849 RepID=UPI0024370B4E|nr:translationally-controlled tumor protein homolog isoform X1 [Periophthalmus magnuspinnatus]
MIIYKCLITGDEMFSDIYEITVTEDGLFYEVQGKCISRKVGCIDDSLIGANASAEEVAEGTEEATESGVDIVLNHSLQQTPPYKKDEFMKYLKAYMKALKTKIEATSPESVTQFQEDAQKAGKKMLNMVLKNKDLEFFTGASMNPEGTLAFLDYRPDGMTPFLTVFKSGLEIEKCVSTNHLLFNWLLLPKPHQMQRPGELFCIML